MSVAGVPPTSCVSPTAVHICLAPQAERKPIPWQWRP